MLSPVKRYSTEKERQPLKRNSLLMLATALQILLLAPLAWWVHNHPVNDFDLKITRTIQKTQSRFLDALSGCLSLLASWQFVNIVAIPLAFALWRARLRLEAAMFVSVAVLMTAGRKLLQGIVRRPRPNPALVHVVKPKKSESFPSGHAATALTGWGWLSLLAGLLLKGKPRWRAAVLSVMTLIIILAGPSRVYLGEHWTTDVLGGYLYGGAWLSFSYQLYLTLKDKGVLSDQKEIRQLLKSRK
jgi:membrane-associated phospholipid phosphatase